MYSITIENYNLLLQRNINSELYSNIPKPLYPERFMRIEGINFNTSLSIYQEIESAGCLSNNMIILNFNN